MKYYALVLSIFLIFYGKTQISYDFGQPLPPGIAEISSVDAMFHGEYTNSDSNLKYEISDSGIYIISTQYSKISRKTIRESTNYSVKDGFIFGVVKNDSLPCFLEGENYYFGIRNRVCLICDGSQNKLKRSVSGTYYLSFYDGGYVPAKLVFTLNSMSISYFNYEDDTRLFDNIESVSVMDQIPVLHTLDPTTEEWMQISTKIFDSALTFRKVSN